MCVANEFRPQQKIMAIIRVLLLSIAVIGIGGCASSSTKLFEEEDLTEHLSGSPSDSKLMPQSVEDLLLGSDPLYLLPEAVDREERFDVSVLDAPVDAFFIGLMDSSGKNLVVHPDVKGRISLDLKQVTLDQVLTVVRDIYGLEYKVDNDIYTIYPKALTTEIFHVDYLDVKRKGISDISVLVGADFSGANNNGQSGGNGASGAGNLSQSSSGQGGDNPSGGGQSGSQQGARIQTTTETDFWTQLQTVINSIITGMSPTQSKLGNLIAGSNGGRQVVISPQSGMIVVRAMPKELAAVRRFLERSQLSVMRQVILETKILEVQLNDEFEAGINWDQLSGSLSWQYQSGGQGSIIGGGDTSNTGDGGGAGNVSGQNGRLFNATLNVPDVTSLLSLLETQGKVKVLSSPKISTVNNQKAVIRAGSDEFFITGVSNSTTTSAATTVQTPQVELASFFSGISLDVTPQISEEGDVILHVHPMVSEVMDQQKSFTLGGQSFSLPLASRDVRESDTIIRAKNGEVVVLGGLMQERISSEKGHRPGLSSIPVFGNLFKTRQRTAVKTELVILLKPTFVNDNTWRRELQQTYRGLRALEDVSLWQ